MIVLRSSGDILDQSLISSIVRKQPKHNLDFGSTTQMLTQGLWISFRVHTGGDIRFCSKL